MEFFSVTWEVYFYQLIGDPQPFEPDKLFIRNLGLKNLQTIVFPETRFILDTDHPEESRSVWLCFMFVRLRIATTLFPPIQCPHPFQ